MKIVETVAELREQLSRLKNTDNTIGFVPTMGALHAGHISLARQSVVDNDITVVSIFVNPNQFNNKEDLEKYPRNLDSDKNLLKQTGVDIIFAPSVKEIYPETDTRHFDFGQIEKVMEGEHRPGHFNGVAQVVSRLFDIVMPHKAYFGEKDFQQLAIIRAMVNQLSLPVEIISMPIIREPNGLAMSSRNERLTNEQKEIATSISKTLFALRDKDKNNISIGEAITESIHNINSAEGLEVEYFDIVDGNNLQSIVNWDDSDYIMACTAVYCGGVRLIDNIRLK